MPDRSRRDGGRAVTPAQTGRPAPHVAQATLNPSRSGSVPLSSSRGGERPLAPHVQAATRAVQARMAVPPSAQPRHVRDALERVVQPQKDRASVMAPPRPGRSPSPTPSARRHSPVVQRMEEKRSYSLSSISKEDTGGNRWSYKNKDGQTLTIVDYGDRFKAYLDDQYVGYISYEVETEDFVRRMRFGYINVSAVKERNKKISSVLIFHLAVKALQSGIQVICVGHPSPELRSYWEAMGFDFKGAIKAQWESNKKLYGEEAAGSMDSVKVVTEAIGSAVTILQWARTSLEKLWNG